MLCVTKQAVQQQAVQQQAVQQQAVQQQATQGQSSAIAQQQQPLAQLPLHPSVVLYLKQARRRRRRRTKPSQLQEF